ncbi:MAG TPA: hypothetical protein VK169_21925 [Saprospiraceae bacterium]|nr:hypothetical protein [Saprospiraceae bacterium]
MIQKYFLLFALAIITNISWAQGLDTLVKTIRLGDDTVYLKIYTKPGKNVVYAHVHENEEASLEAGMEVLKKYGGKLFTLSHSIDTTNRNVTFEYNKTTYQFDPNRIYTTNDTVLQKNIKIISGDGKVDTKVKKDVRNLANIIWSETKGAKLIVALHNNKNTPATFKTLWFFINNFEPESYNITSYVKKSEFASDSNKSCDEIYINPRLNNSEFFIVTEKRDFDLFLQKKYSVVLQNAEPIDDGSMSVFAVKNKRRYINSEAKMGKIIEQTEMLELLHKAPNNID